MSIATEISRLQSAKASIKTAIEGKGVTVPSATLLDGYAALISSIPSGGSTDEISYPAWLKDGDTHLWIDIRNSYQLDHQLRIRMIGTIDWGDGTVESVSVTKYTTFTHTYSAPGKYRIDLHPTSGTFYLGGASTNYNVMGTRSGRYNIICALYQAEVGSSIITSLSDAAFYYTIGLQRVYVPANIVTMGSYMFQGCGALKEVVFANSATITTDSFASTFYSCQNLQECNFIPAAATSLHAVYYNCYAITEITIPSTVTSLGNNCVRACNGLKYLHCLPTTPPTATSSTFTGLPSFCVIEVPSASLATYKAANIWSTYASQMVGV